MSNEPAVESVEFSSRNGLQWRAEIVIATYPDLVVRIESTHHSEDGQVGSKDMYREAIDRAVLALQALQK